MTSTARLFSSLVIAGCLVLVASQRLGFDALAISSKLVASSAFIGLALVSGALRATWSRVLLAGLGLSWIGDLALTNASRTAFLAGLAAFLAAHVAYTIAFLLHGTEKRWMIAAALPVAVSAAATLAWLDPLLPAGLEWPVRFYTVAISLMVVAAAGATGSGRDFRILAGALMFFVSDLSVAALRIAETDAATYVWGLPLYYGGQLLLAWSVSQSRSH